jgi:hypothetical protein
MVEPQIRYDDGAVYERYMGKWSRLAGEIFLNWLAPLPGLRWIDVGCGSGAFTELLVERCAPAEVQGIDPSERRNSPLRALDQRRAWRSFARATLRCFPSPKTVSMNYKNGGTDYRPKGDPRRVKEPLRCSSCLPQTTSSRPMLAGNHVSAHVNEPHCASAQRLGHELSRQAFKFSYHFSLMENSLFNEHLE